jgi:hypothetical protein
MPLGKLIYMPEESTPTIATEGNREAVAYLELGEHTEHYGHLFARAPQTAEFLSTIAAMKKDGEDGWFMESDDATDVVNALIDKARALTAKANGDAA